METMNLEDMSIEEIRRHVVDRETQEAEKISSELLMEIKKNIFNGDDHKVLDLDKLPRHVDKVAKALEKEGLKVRYAKGYRGEVDRFEVFLPKWLRCLDTENKEEE